MTFSAATTPGAAYATAQHAGAEDLVRIAEDFVRETRLPAVLTQVLAFGLERAEAERGHLLLEHEGTWTIQATGQVDGEPAIWLETAGIEPGIEPDTGSFAQLLRRVAYTRTTLLLPEDADGSEVVPALPDPQTAANPVLCVPLLNQRRLSALLYLERSQTAGAFARDRVRVLEHISGLMAIAIDNARAIEDLQRQAEKRAQEPQAGRENQLDPAPVPRTENSVRRGASPPLRTQPVSDKPDISLIRAQVAQITAEADKRKLRAMLNASEAAEDHFRALLEAAPDAVVITDRNGRISLVNLRTEEVFGYERAELLGQPVEMLLPERHRGLHVAHRWRYATLPHPRPMGSGLEIFGRRRDGSEFPVEVSLSPITAKPGMQIAATIRDVTERKRIENALRESERLVRSTFDALPEHICVLDETGTIVAVNKSWREFGAANDADPSRIGEGANYLAVCDAARGEGADNARAFANGLRAMMRGERDECEVEYPCHSDAAARWFMCRTTRFPKIGPIRFVVSHENITESKRAEQALREAKEAAEAAKREEADRRQEADRRRHIAESLRNVLSILNSERPLGHVLEYIASEANRLLGSQAALVYRSGTDTGLTPIQAQHESPAGARHKSFIPVDLDALRQNAHARGAIAIPFAPGTLADSTEQPEQSEPSAFMIPVPEGCSALVAIPIVIKDDVYGGLVLYNATERVLSQEEIELAVTFADQAALAIENASLKEQAKQAAAAAERNRLARDLHDAVTQVIFSANLIAEALPRVWERDPAEGQRGLVQLGQLTRGALAELRALLFELRPGALLDKPLPDLLRQLTEAMTNRAHAPITFEARGACILPSDVHVAVYRIALEALNNVVKHAEAHHVTVHLSCAPNRLALRIRDDGRGFEVGAVKADHLGMSIMRERARSIGADFRLISHLGHGTQVVLNWPAATSARTHRARSTAITPPAVRQPGQQHGKHRRQA